jgi:C2 domain
MSKQQIETEVMKESTDWLDTGSGDVARIFIEILGCNGLPNLDSGGFLGNKTDAFVGLVFEDTWAQTDVIDDCLSPRWLPWMKRAFIFHQSHSSSQLFLGVFDHDIGLDDHDLIGRVSVDLSNLRANTMYTLTYDIFPTARMTERKSKGSITLRLRMEIDDERKLLTCCLEPPRTQYVNVKKRKEFKTIQYTCTGKYDMDGYSMKVITS